MSTEIENVLARIATALEAKEPPKLGLSIQTQRKWLYVGQEQGTCWYFCHNNENIPVIENLLTGVVKSIEIADKEFKGKTEQKLQITIDAGTKYILQSGITTIFSRGILIALNLLSETELTQPIAIGVKAGNQESIVLGSVYQNDEKIRCDWDETLDLLFIATDINTRLKQPPPILTASPPALPPISDAPYLNLDDYRRKIFEATNRQIKRLAWGAEQGSNYLRTNYNGKVNRSQLTNEELADFANKLESIIIKLQA